VPDVIDWEGFGAALTSAPTARQHWICRILPRCGEPVDIKHIWQCRHDMDFLWDTALRDLRCWLDENNMHLEISNPITDGLAWWRTGSPEGRNVKPYPGFHNLGLEQDYCGWCNFF
jgi:hypothetical protein